MHRAKAYLMLSVPLRRSFWGFGAALRARAEQTQQAFLRNAGNELARAAVDQAAGEPARPAAVRAVLRIEQPVVGAKGPMKPKRMIEAGDLDVGVEQRAAVRDHRHVEQRHIGKIGENGAMHRRIVRQPACGPDPYILPVARLRPLMPR